MTEQLRIYVAGPYSPKSDNKHKCIREASYNTFLAIMVGIALLDKGHIPFVPHLSHYIHTHPLCRKEYLWYTIDNSFLQHWANALFYMKPSFGADMELKLAKDLGHKIFYSLDEVPEADVKLWSESE